MFMDIYGSIVEEVDMVDRAYRIYRIYSKITPHKLSAKVGLGNLIAMGQLVPTCGLYHRGYPVIKGCNCQSSMN